MVKVTLKRNEGRTISAGGLWIFDNEIEKIEGEYQNGDIVEVVSYKDDHIGKGYINDHSKIMIRILSRSRQRKSSDTTTTSPSRRSVTSPTTSTSHSSSAAAETIIRHVSRMPHSKP